MSFSRRLVPAVSVALSSFVFAACSGSAPRGSGEDVGSSGQSLTPVCRTVTLDAEKDYGMPAKYVDGTASVSPAMRADVPRTLLVTAGKSGHGTVTLRVRNGSHVATCTYRGHGDGDCDRDDQGSASTRYRLEHCSRLDGDDVTGSDFTLHVDDGDWSDPAHKTAVEVTLHEEGHCTNTPPPPPPDAGTPPPPATCATAAECDDGNVCTTDACSSGACTHAAAADGTSCDDHNSCTAGDACTAGKCGGTSAADGTSCDDSMGCMTGGACSAGKCSGGSALADGTSCGATDLCDFSSTAVCTAGMCHGTPDCGGAECISSACVATTGACLPAPAGTPCSSGACDGNFNCVAGTAATSVTTTAPLCPPPAGFECNATSGAYDNAQHGCVYAALPAGTACSTGVCDGDSNCVAMASGPGSGTPLVLGAACPVNAPCTAPGAIDFATGACVYVDDVAGAACGSGGHCDGHGTCGP